MTITTIKNTNKNTNLYIMVAYEPEYETKEYNQYLETLEAYLTITKTLGDLRTTPFDNTIMLELKDPDNLMDLDFVYDEILYPAMRKCWDYDCVLKYKAGDTNIREVYELYV